jgi:methanogenic corrinoid protein MtbC1
MTVEPLPERVGLGEAADILGVHYMTAYRYVRTGKLAAKRESARWSVAVDDLKRLQPSPPGRLNGSSLPQRRTQMAKRMINGDDAGAWHFVEAALTSGRTPSEVYAEIVAPCLRLIGEQWESGQISVAEEHRSSVVALRIIGRLGPQFARRGKSRGTVVMGAVAGEWHALPGLMLADVVRARGFEPLDLGANTPAVSFVEAAQSADRLVAVLVGATTSDSDEALRDVISALRGAGVSVPILAGGRALRDEAHALALGVDAWSGHDASTALAAVELAYATSLSKVE